MLGVARHRSSYWLRELRCGSGERIPEGFSERPRNQADHLLNDADDPRVDAPQPSSRSRGPRSSKSSRDPRPDHRTHRLAPSAFRVTRATTVVSIRRPPGLRLSHDREGETVATGP